MGKQKSDSKKLKLTFAGKKLEPADRSLRERYENRDVLVVKDWDDTWFAEPNYRGDISWDGYVVARDPQEALDKLYVKLQREFKKIGVALGYDVED